MLDAIDVYFKTRHNFHFLSDVSDNGLNVLDLALFNSLFDRFASLSFARRFSLCDQIEFMEKEDG